MKVNPKTNQTAVQPSKNENSTPMKKSAKSVQAFIEKNQPFSQNTMPESYSSSLASRKIKIKTP